MTTAPFVDVKNLRRVFDVSKPWLNRVLEGGHLEFLKAVDGVTFDIRKGETFALVGESGSGKTTVARMVVGLLPPTSGEVVIDGVSMSDAGQLQARQRLRRRIQMIFQDPYASLNPRFRVDAIVAEPIRAFDLIQGERNIQARVGELLSLVGLHADDLIELMARDKKSAGGLTFVLDGPNGIERVDNPDPDAVRKALAAIRVEA